MNKTKIEWTNYSWNPITGCKHGCWYCYASKLFTRFHKSFEPTFYVERLHEIYHLKKPSKIFVCSVSDLFAPWTPEKWRDIVLIHIFYGGTPHIFQLLTKNPERIPKNFHFPKNVWVGTTVTNLDGDDKNIEALKQVDAETKFVSFEPLLGRLRHPLDGETCLLGIQWVIIGKLTGSRKIPLNPSWVRSILDEADCHSIPVFMKNNLFQASNPKDLEHSLDIREKRQEWPL